MLGRTLEFRKERFMPDAESFTAANLHQHFAIPGFERHFRLPDFCHGLNDFRGLSVSL
jgi:hypothetical protein